MIDIVQLRVIAGDGGHGRISFRREKFVSKGGPDGGHGGDGGSVVIRATDQLSTLTHLSGVTEVLAEAGQVGGDRQKTGRSSPDVVVRVPVGTVVWQKAAQYEMALPGVSMRELRKNRASARHQVYEFEKETDRMASPDRKDKLSMDRLDTGRYSLQDVGDDKQELVRLTKSGQEFVLCRGGIGGRGNELFKGPARTTPLIAEYGTPGEERVVVLELQLLADVGLVGFPNAGKSTFISRVTKSRPKIANYPFTTLEPNLGVWLIRNSGASDGGDVGANNQVGLGREVVVADIPGLIEGASQGKGLGHDFLRHIKACRVLIFVLFLSEEEIFDEGVTWEEKADLMWQQYQTLWGELIDYNEEMKLKPQLISVNKIDIYPAELIAAVEKKFVAEDSQPIFFSGVTGQGVAELEKQVGELLAKIE